MHSSCFNCIHLQRLILCIICVVGQKTAEIINILVSAECSYSLEKGQDDTSLASCWGGTGLAFSFVVTAFPFLSSPSTPLYYCISGHFWFCMLGCRERESVQYQLPTPKDLSALYAYKLQHTLTTAIVKCS